MHCVASDSSSSWHNFVSNTKNWKDKNDKKILCQNDQGFIPPGKNKPFIASMLNNGAQKIWIKDEKTVTLIGSPAMNSESPERFCYLMPVFGNTG